MTPRPPSPPPPADERPGEAVGALAACRTPHLVGVRHHAPSLAAVMPALLDAARPDVLYVELPAEAGPWLPWLADPATRAPVALAGNGPHGLGFHPFADFSPELAALRWAYARGVEVVPCDLPLAHPAWAAAAEPGGGGPGALHARLRAGLSGRDGEDLWDRLVEAAAPGSAPEAVRRAALAVGWALRRDAGGRVGALDLAREAWMRARIAEAGGRRAVAVVGAFHAPVLVAGPRAEETAEETAEAPGTAPAGEVVMPGGDVVMSLIPYTYALLDSRSGYPAGIRDPEWQHAVLDAAGDPAAIREALTRAAVRVCARLRAQGHPSGPADAREVVRVAGDLAALRGLPAPGRGELVEAAQTVLTHGEPLGRGRAVAAALDHVLVGTRTGAPAPGAPRGGLGPDVEAAVAALALPGPGDGGERDLRLDPLRVPGDRRRDLLLHRLTVVGVPYAEPVAVTGTGGADALTTRWRVRWTPATTAMLEVASVRGATLEQAAEGVLRQTRRRQDDAGGPTAADLLAGLDAAARCALPALTRERLAEAVAALPSAASPREMLDALRFTDRVAAGLVDVPGIEEDAAALAAALTSAAVRDLAALAGSDDAGDARALVDLATRADRDGGLRLAAVLAGIEAHGSPLMAAAAAAVRVLTGERAPAGLGALAASWTDAATTPDGRARLGRRLTGLLTAAGPLLEAGGAALTPLLDRIGAMDDRAFVDRLPALRAGFAALSPADRGRLLEVVEDRVGDRVGADVPDPALLAARAAADVAGREALIARGLADVAGLAPPPGTPAGGSETSAGAAPEASPRGARSARTARSPGAHETSDAHGAGGAPHVPGALDLHGGPPQAAHAARSSDAHETSDAHEPGGAPHAPQPAPNPGAPDPGTAPAPAHPAASLTPADRWRLVLGRRSARQSGHAARLGAALDELYGTGRGEGSRGDLGAGGRRGGDGAPVPTVREWAEELSALFGPSVREEVLAAAVEAGRLDVAAEIDPARVRPSVELLRTVLAYAGGLPEARLARLRPLVRRLVDDLTRELATRMRPALTGLATPRPTRRPGGPLDLAATVRANLGTARPGEDGAVTLIPERPVFRTRARRGADWRVVLVVDVSGSMEASVIWSALTASILAGVPALSTRFLAFSTEVADLSEHVADPLSLLLEVSVGGGTDIATGLRAARDLVTVPSRTIVAVVSDFEDGGPPGRLLAEVRALAGSGCHVLGLASLDDAGRPRYCAATARRLVAAGMPVAALSPAELARWIGEKVR